MLSRDRAGLDPGSAVSQRWRRLVAYGAELDIVIAAPSDAHWEEKGLRVHGTGGSNPFVRLRRLVREARKGLLICDLVTAQDPFELGWAAWRAARMYEKPFEIQDHGGFFDGGTADEPLWVIRKHLAQWLVRRASRIRTVSPKSFDLIGASWMKEKTYLLPIAADDRFAGIARAPENGLIVSVGRLIPVKRFDLLIRAVETLRQAHSFVRLAIVGDGPERARLEQLVSARGMTDVVTFAGAGDPSPWLARADVFALVSAHEGWGVAAVEAAEAGVPVVMTDTGCASWLAERGAATVVAPDPEAIAAALAARLGSGEVRISDALTPDASVRLQIEAWQGIIEEKPRALICAQAVDEDDALFGFFVGWLRAFAERGRAIVCALRVSDPPPDLGEGIEVVRSRPADSSSRWIVLLTIARISWKERFRYRSVFVRGDAQYVACLGWLWRLLGKRVVFWYTHYTVKGPWFWLAVPWANEVVTAVPESNPLRSAIPVGHHIDTQLFTPDVREVQEGPMRVLVFGRVSPVKRVPWIARSLASLHETGRVVLNVVGPTTDQKEAAELRSAMPQGATWEERNVPHASAPDLYRQADVLINATPGSMDKTIIEAAATGCIPIAMTRGYLRGLPSDLDWLCVSDAQGMTDALERLLRMSPSERAHLRDRVRTWALASHSLTGNVRRIAAFLFERAPRPRLKQRIRRLLWRFIPSKRGGIAVLMYHAMDGKGAAGWDVDRFSALMDRLSAFGLRVKSLPAVFESGPMAQGPENILLTFDDATSDIATVLPVLRSAGLGAVVFAPSGIRTHESSDGMIRPVLGEDELPSLVDAQFTIGGHGVSHTKLTTLSPTDAEEEIRASASFIQRLNPPEAPKVFAYPSGKSDARIRALTADAGFVAAFGVMPGRWTADSDRFNIPRIPILWWMSSRDVLRAIRVF